MSDTPRETSKEIRIDRNDRIDVQQPVELRLWAHRLGVSEYHLRWTVNKVGPDPRAVALDLGKLL